MLQLTNFSKINNYNSFKNNESKHSIHYDDSSHIINIIFPESSGLNYEPMMEYYPNSFKININKFNPLPFDFFKTVVIYLDTHDIGNSFCVSKKWNKILSKLPEANEILRFNHSQASRIYWKSPCHYLQNPILWRLYPNLTDPQNWDSKNPTLRERINTSFKINEHLLKKSQEVNYYNFSNRKFRSLRSCLSNCLSSGFIYNELKYLIPPILFYYFLLGIDLHLAYKKEINIKELKNDAEILCKSLYNITYCLADFKSLNITEAMHQSNLNETIFLEKNHQLFNDISHISVENTKYLITKLYGFSLAFSPLLVILSSLKSQTPEFYLEGEKIVSLNCTLNNCTCHLKNPSFAKLIIPSLIQDLISTSLVFYLAINEDEENLIDYEWCAVSLTLCQTANHFMNWYRPYFMKKIRDRIEDKIKDTFQSIGLFFSRISTRLFSHT